MSYLEGFVSNVSKSIEEIFYQIILNTIEEKGYIEINGYKFNQAYKNGLIGLKKRRKEVDILLLNSEDKNIGIIEVKTRLNKNDVDKLTEIEEYIRSDNRFKKYDFIIGFASPTIEDELKESVLKEGYFLIKFNAEEENMELILPRELRVYRPPRGFMRKILSLLFSY